MKSYRTGKRLVSPSEMERFHQDPDDGYVQALSAPAPVRAIGDPVPEVRRVAKGRSEPTLYGAFMDWHGENIVGTALMYDPATLQRTVYQPLHPLQTHTGKPPLWPNTRRFKLRTRDLAITSVNEHPR